MFARRLIALLSNSGGVCSGLHRARASAAEEQLIPNVKGVYRSLSLQRTEEGNGRKPVVVESQLLVLWLRVPPKKGAARLVLQLFFLLLRLD